MTIRSLTKFRPIGGDANTDPGSPELNIGPLNFAHNAPPNTPIAGPNVRTISNVVSGSNGDGPDSPNLSDWNYIWGQFVDHDLDLENPSGAPININDPSLPGGVIDLNRALRDPATNTIINNVAGYLDLSQVYGSTAAVANSLRNADGTMKTSDNGNALSIVNGQFVAGDVRVMENPELIAVTTLFVKEHNYWVGALRAQHPAWTGDQLYNMARAITTAEYQNVTYSEYLKATLGSAAPTYHGFDPRVNSQVTQQFSTSAFRFGHSQISANQERIDNQGNLIGSQSLADAFGNTPAQDIANGFNALIRSFSNETGGEVDVYAIDVLRNLLAAAPDFTDLIAIDIQRERDVGIGSLNDTRVALGFKPYTSFAQITSDTTVQANLAAMYGNVNNLDLFIGGLAETHVHGGAVGQTFSAIIADQFARLETGDKYFWKNQDFDPATKQMIAQTTLGDIIERNTGTPAEQQNVFLAAERHLSTVAADDPTAPQLVIGVDDPGAHISGGIADDTIVAGLGLNQVLTGGRGADVFMFNGPGHTATITDWSKNDKIQFQDIVGDAAISVQDFPPGGHNEHASHYDVVRYGGNTITVLGVPPNLNAADFILSPGQTPHILDGI